MAIPLPDSPDIHDEYWDNHVFIELVERDTEVGRGTEAGT